MGEIGLNKRCVELWCAVCHWCEPMRTSLSSTGWEMKLPICLILGLCQMGNSDTPWSTHAISDLWLPAFCLVRTMGQDNVPVSVCVYQLYVCVHLCLCALEGLCVIRPPATPLSFLL